MKRSGAGEWVAVKGNYYILLTDGSWLALAGLDGPWPADRPAVKVFASQDAAKQATVGAVIGG